MIAGDEDALHVVPFGVRQDGLQGRQVAVYVG
jgi:hypothetical protein